MGRQGTIPVASLKILKAVSEEPGITQTRIGDELDLSFTAVSRHFRSTHDYGVLDRLLVKENGSDGREKKVFVREGYEEEAETLIDAYDVLERLREE